MALGDGIAQAEEPQACEVAEIIEEATELLEDEAEALARADAAIEGTDAAGGLALTVAYRGEAFSGYARQPGQLTVQGELEQALQLVFRRPVATVCAGRTDTGVHACGQVVSFPVTSEELAALDGRRLLRSLNALTHDDIAVREVRPVPLEFSARFDACWREYRYFLCIDEVPPVLSRDFAWHCGPLDAGAMERASRCLIGEQDFKSFCKAVSAVDKPTCRNLMEVSFREEEHGGEHLLVMRVVGSSFLHSMVRTLVGTLAMVGKGKRPEGWVAEVLDARDRTAAGECAPACGLVLWKVGYEGEADAWV